jgi:ubiquinone/menaquinone biosynthesis C-methylase UbiE
MDQQTIITYNKISNEYDKETANFWKLFPNVFIDKFIELSGKRIVDVGSGPGRDGLLFKNAKKDVVCVDASEAMVNLCSGRGLEAVLAGFDNLPFEDKSFEGAWSYTALLHVPKKSIRSPLREIYRVLKPSGIFALGLIEGNTEEYRESAGAGMLRWFSLYQKDEIVKICEDNNFELVWSEELNLHTKKYLHFIFRKV